MRRLVVPLVVALVTGVVLGQEKPPELPAIAPASAKLARTVEGLTSPGTSIAFADGKGVVVAGCEDGSLRLWTREEGKELLADAKMQTVKGHRETVTSVAAAGGVVASGSMDGKLLVWSLPADKPTHTLSTGAAVRAVALSADGKQLASGGDDNAVQLWDPATGKQVAKLTGPTDWVLAVAFSPDGKLVAAGGHDGRLWLWETESGKKLFDVAVQLPGAAKDAPAVVVYSLAFSPDSKKVAVGGSDARIHEYEAAGAGKHLRGHQGHTSTVTGLAYHPGGNVLISSSKDRTLRLWNLQSGGTYKTLEGHTAWVQGVALVEKGTLALSVSADRTVRVWDLGATAAKGKK